MSLSNLSLSLKCLNSIGNSLSLNKMITKFLKNFIKESNALSGKFYLLENKKLQKKEICVGKNVAYELREDSINEIHYSIKEEDDFNVLTYKLDKAVLQFFYEKNHDVDFCVSILDSLVSKLNISIDSCLNVEVLKDKNKQLKKQKKRLKKLTLHLKDEISQATKKNLEKERQIYDQLKMVQMGELIGNIAHQWRQPLSVISTAASGIQIKKELNVLNDYDFDGYIKSIIDNSMYLSNTIEEFREYIKEGTAVKNVLVQDRIKAALDMVESSFLANKIKIRRGRVEEEKIFYSLVLGDLLQVLISIFNNAKDALLENNIEDKWIKYELIKNEYSITITVEDNAGGIDDEIINKIFDPYFTTKHKSQGTGIGLYGAYGIVVNKLNGKLYVKNSENGAKFFIELPNVVDYAI